MTEEQIHPIPHTTNTDPSNMPAPAQYTEYTPLIEPKLTFLLPEIEGEKLEPPDNACQTRPDPPDPADPSHRDSTGNPTCTDPSLTLTVSPCTGDIANRPCLTPPTPSTTSPPCTGGRTDPAQTNPTPTGPDRGLVACISRGPPQSLSRLPCIKLKNIHDTRSTFDDKKLESPPSSTSPPAGKTTPPPSSPPPGLSSTAPRTGASQPPGQSGRRSPPSLVKQEDPRNSKIKLRSKYFEALPPSDLPHGTAEAGPPPPPRPRPCSTAPGSWATKPPGSQASRSPPSLDPGSHPTRPCRTAPGTWATEPPGPAACSSPSSLAQRSIPKKKNSILIWSKLLEPLPDPPPPPPDSAADLSPSLPPPPPRSCRTAPGRWAPQSPRASASSSPPGPIETEKPKTIGLKTKPWLPTEQSPSGTPRSASSTAASTPAAGTRGSQPGQQHDCGRPSPRAAVPEKIELEINSETAWLDPPGLGREEGQLGQQRRQHRGSGSLREADGRENPVSSSSNMLARTAAKKRNHEDDSEIGQAGVRIAPKKAKNDEKFNGGGGGLKPLKNQKLGKN